MKILFITDLYPIKKGEATTPKTLHNFVIEWIRQGHQVDVIKPNFVLNSFRRGKPYYKNNIYLYDEVKIFNVNYVTPFFFDVTKKIPTEYDLASYDLVIAHMPSGIIFANKIAQKFKKPLICAVHSSDIDILTKPIYKFYFKSRLISAYKNAQKIACRSFVLQKKFCNIFPELCEKTFVALSGVNTDTGAKATALAHSPLKVLTCANLIKRKNIDKLILAINDLAGFKLTIIGDGPEMKKLKKISSENVEFIGRLPHEMVLEKMNESDIFILPSVNETFGMVYLEAMASGCITICTKNDGIDGIIVDSQNGFLCSPNATEIRKTLLRLKEFENIEQISQNSLDTIAKLTCENCAKEYLKK